MAQQKINYIEFPYILPGVHLHKCPKCGSSKIEIVNIKGVALKNFGGIAALATAGVLGGAVGGAVYGAIKKSRDAKAPPIQLATIRYQCEACKEKFEEEPHGTTEADILEAPFTITFTRKGIFGDDPYSLYINGVFVSMIPTLTNTFVFPTSIRHNTLMLIGPTGKPMKNGIYEFRAQPGGSINLLYTKKQFCVE